MRRMLTAKLQNRSGVLNRFTGVLSRRQVNIESISVGATENPNVSRITIIIDVASHDEVEQIIKQLNRQVDVIRVRDITDKPHLEREVILIKVSAPAEKRAEILAIIQPFRATVVDVAPSSITVQMTGNAEKSEALIRVIRPIRYQEYRSDGSNWIYPAINTLRKSLQITSALPCRTQVQPAPSFLICSLIFIV